MPLYDFRCNSCGEFEAWRTLAELDQPMACPTCQGCVIRLLSVPNINLSSGNLRALERQGSVEPQVVRRDGLRPAASGHRKPNSPRHQSASSARPWMISHTRAHHV